jgi:hypothetical protein
VRSSTCASHVTRSARDWLHAVRPIPTRRASSIKFNLKNIYINCFNQYYLEIKSSNIQIILQHGVPGISIVGAPLVKL